MSLLKLLQKTIESHQLAKTQLNKNLSQDQLDNLANTFIRIINRRQLKTPKEIKRAKHAISNRLIIECEKNSQISELMIDQIRKAVFSKIDEKLCCKPGNSKRDSKISRKRAIESSDEDQISEDDQNEAKTSEQSSKTKRIHKQIQNTNLKTRKKRKYETYDQEFKLEVCLYAEIHGPEEAAKKFRLPSRKIMNWLEAHQLNQLGRGRKAFDPIMQFNLCIWILRKIWDQVPLTQKVIRQKAATLKTLSKPFNGSKGWLEKFFLRHVELKSCFDTRNKQQLKTECARYHRCAFARLGKDSEDLIKNGEDVSRIVRGDLSKIIYFKQDHSLLKFKADKYLDNQAIDNRPFYNYDEIKDIQVKKFEEDECDEEDEECEEQDEECMTPGPFIGTKSEQSYQQQEEQEVQYFESSMSEPLQKQEQQIDESEQESIPKNSEKFEQSVKYGIYEESEDQNEIKIPIKKQLASGQTIKKHEDDEQMQ